jgi:hypothetical protein
LSESDAVDLMAAFPKLERLALYGFQSDGFLKALAKRDNNNDRSPAEGSCRLPQLTTIGIYWATLKVLRKVVSSRQKISISIRRIRCTPGMLTGIDRKDPDFEWLKKHVNLDFSLRHDSDS